MNLGGEIMNDGTRSSNFEVLTIGKSFTGIYYFTFIKNIK